MDVKPTSGENSKMTLEDWLSSIDGLARTGDLLRAYDHARQALKVHPDSLELKYKAVLMLARAEAREEARRQFQDLGLETESDMRVRALRARLVKDEALAASGNRRVQLAIQSAKGYEALYKNAPEDPNRYYPGINAASMYLIGGATAPAKLLARQVRDGLLDEDAAPDDAYYRAASEAEALIILDDLDGARDRFAAARAALGNRFDILAGTLRQFRWLLEKKKADTDWLKPFGPPATIHFCGHIISRPGKNGRFPAAAEKDVEEAIRQRLADLDVGFGYGSLAAGSDILFAEALIDRRAEVHVGLPFAKDDFLKTSVAPFGAEWVARFHRCLDKATSVNYATEGSHLGDDGLYGFCSLIAMGLAVLRSRYLQGEAVQLAVWDGKDPGGPAGTAADLAYWRRLELRQEIIPLEAPEGAKITATMQAPEGRRQRAMLFADIKGFSRLSDRDLSTFIAVGLGGIAEVLEGLGEKVLFRNTWGDGIFAVFDDLESAADCALQIRDAVAAIDAPALGLPKDFGIRTAVHFGPVYQARDPVCGNDNFFGAEVSRAARLEPVTPVNEVYVSLPFAAILALEGGGRYACDYVGIQPAAKGYGDLPMYLLRRR